MTLIYIAELLAWAQIVSVALGVFLGGLVFWAAIKFVTRLFKRASG